MASRLPGRFPTRVGILAGGLGTRLSEETQFKPKPMVEVGGYPLLWHIMKAYGAHGFDEFVVACGYRGDVISDWFSDYRRRRARSLTIDLVTDEQVLHNGTCEPWRVHLLDTGQATQTGGRVKRVLDFVGREPILLTYGDAVSDIDVSALVRFHREQGRLATVTAVRPPARFGALDVDGAVVRGFSEKPPGGEGWISGGFFVLEPEVIDYVADDDTVFESGPLVRLAEEGELAAYCHEGFWQCMDSMREVELLRRLWDSGRAPWRTWGDEAARLRVAPRAA